MAKEKTGRSASGEETKTCANCGAENGVEWTFCHACRVPFEGQAKKKHAKKSAKKKSAKKG